MADQRQTGDNWTRFPSLRHRSEIQARRRDVPAGPEPAVQTPRPHISNLPSRDFKESFQSTPYSGESAAGAAISGAARLGANIPYGMTEGLARYNPIALSVDFVNYALKQLPGGKYLSSKTPVFGSEMNVRMLRAMGLLDNPKQDPDAMNQFVRDVFKEVGANVVPYALIVRMSGRLMKLAPTVMRRMGIMETLKKKGSKEAAKAMGRKVKDVGKLVGRGMVEQAQKLGPGKFAATELGESIIQGTGAAAGKVLTSPGGAWEGVVPQPLAEVIGGVGGPVIAKMSPTLMVARAAGRFGKSMVDKWLGFTPKGRIRQQQRATERAAEMLDMPPGTFDSETIRENMERAFQVADASVPPIDQSLTGPARDAALAARSLLVRKALPTTAQATGSQALKVTEESMTAGKSGGALDQQVAKRKAQEDAVSHAEKSGPETTGTGTPEEQLVAQAQLRSQKIVLEIEGQSAALKERAVALGSGVPHITDPANFGITVRSAMDSARSKVKKVINKQWKDMGLNRHDVTAEFSAYRKSFFRGRGKVDGILLDEHKDLKNMVNNIGISERVHFDEIGRALPQTGKKLKSKVTFQAIKNFREEVGRELRDAIYNKKSKRARMLMHMQNKVDIFMRKTDFSGADPQLSVNWEKARKDYFTNYIDVFERTTIVKIMRKGNRVDYVTAPELIAQDLFKSKGGNRAITDWKRMFGVSQNSAILDVMLDNLNQYLGLARGTGGLSKNATIDPKKFQDWRYKYQNAIDHITRELGPVFENKLNSLESANNAIMARKRTLDHRRSVIGNDALVATMNKVNGKKAEDMVSGILDDPKLTDRMLRDLRGNEPGMAALRRSVWNKATKLNAEGIANYMSEHKSVLKKILGPVHYKSLENIMTFKGMIEFVDPPKGAAIDPSGDWAKEALHTSYQAIFGRLWAAKTGRVHVPYVAFDLFSTFFRGYSKKNAMDVFDRAIYDPDVAKDLSKMTLEPTKKQRTLAARRLKVTLFNLGMRGRTEMLTKDGEDGEYIIRPTNTYSGQAVPYRGPVPTPQMTP
jgi:hypothetical protein